MKNYISTLFFSLFALFLLSNCASNSTITIPPYQKFILGERETSGFNVQLNNLSKYNLDIETWNLDDKKTSGFGLSPKGKTKVGVSGEEKVFIKNMNPKSVKVQAKISKNVEGMRYEVMNLNNLKSDKKLKDSNLEPLISNKWEGTLTYMDYSSGKKVSIPCNLKITKVKENIYKVDYIYPDEPKANSSDKVKISSEGRKFDNKEVIKADEEEGYFIVKTIAKGKDNNKEATLFYTYKFNEKELIMRKDFQTIGSDEVKFRNEYKFEKK